MYAMVDGSDGTHQVVFFPVVNFSVLRGLAWNLLERDRRDPLVGEISKCKN